MLDLAGLVVSGCSMRSSSKWPGGLLNRHASFRAQVCPRTHKEALQPGLHSAARQVSCGPSECALGPGRGPRDVLSVPRHAWLPRPEASPAPSEETLLIQASETFLHSSPARLEPSPRPFSRRLCQERGRSRAGPRPRWRGSPEQGHFLRLSKRALSFLPNI